MTAALERGDLLPRMLVPPPGPACRTACRRLAAVETPGANTLPAGQPTILWREALGANVVDLDGNRYLDFTSGFGAAAVGHRHPRIVAAVHRQTERLIHGLGDVHAHPSRLDLASELVRRSPVPDAVVSFAVSGADAVEIALKTAELATRRSGVVAFSGAYHGLTLGALAVTDGPPFRAPFADRLPDTVRRLPYGCEPELLEAALVGPPAPGSVIVEPILGRGGIVPPPPGWLATVAACCRRRGVLLIADEILTGVGRTGEVFATTGAGVEPDLLCCGKALAGGLPLAAVIGRRSVMSAWPDVPFAIHTATFVAHPLACAAALELWSLLDDEELIPRVATLGRRVGDALADWAETVPGVTAVRGSGLLWGIELNGGERAARLVEDARSLGLLVLAAGRRGEVIELLPPYTITVDQLDAGLGLLRQALDGTAER